jgi:hypothetical protein
MSEELKTFMFVASGIGAIVCTALFIALSVSHEFLPSLFAPAAVFLALVARLALE